MPKVIRLLVIIFLGLGACTRVSPYQRETLARRDMQIASEKFEDGKEHAKAYREGSIGGGNAKAGGCGCN